MTSQFLLVMLAGLATPSNELWIEYRDCVEAFAMGQIGSGESAEILLQVGEAECRDRLPSIREAVRSESMDFARRWLKENPGFSLQELIPEIEEGVERQMNETLNLMRTSVIRNIVVVKARSKALEDR